MAEEATAEAPEVPDTPEPAATPDTPDVDYRKRYEDLQPEYTRATQKLADEQALLEHIAEKFPHLIADDQQDPDLEDDPVYDEDPDEPVNADVEELKAWRAARDAERAEEAFENDFKEAIGDREISKQARSFIENRTVALGNNPEALSKAVDEWFEAVAPAKPKPRVPNTPTGGGAPDDFDASKADLDQMMARARELAANTSTD